MHSPLASGTVCRLGRPLSWRSITGTSTSWPPGPRDGSKEAPPPQLACLQAEAHASGLDPDDSTLLAKKIADLLRSLGEIGTSCQEIRLASEEAPPPLDP